MKSQPNSGIEQLKEFIRRPFAWPGGYPKFALMGDCEPICHNCAEENYRRIVSDILQGYDKSFQIIGVDINWEDEDMICCNCNNKIPSAYGED